MKIKKRSRRLLILIGIAAIILFGLNLIYKLFLDPYRGTVRVFANSKSLESCLTKKEAITDLTFIKEKLTERHPACMKGLPDMVQAQYDKEINSLTDQVTVLQLWQASARILSKMKDAHTCVYLKAADNRKLPLQFEMADGELHCTTKDYDNAVVKSINGISAEELHQKFLEQLSYELENYASYLFAKYLPYKNYLQFMGVDTSSDIKVTFLASDGEKEETFTFEEILESTSEEGSFVSYQIDEGNSLGILTLHSCIINDDYCRTVKEFFTEVKEHGIKNVAVDLRHNGGGNSGVINEFLKYIDIDKYYTTGGVEVRYGSALFHMKKAVNENNKNEELLFTGSVYALTSTNSFSSAEMFANTLQDNQIGRIIGEIPGNMPESYGDNLTFQTPNAKLVFSVSYKHFKRIDQSKAELALIPDYEVKAENAMYKLYEIIKADK